MVRIPLPSIESFSPEQRRVYDAIVGLRGGNMPAPYRPALLVPELADKWQQLGELLRYRTSLPPRLTELAVLLVGRHHDCQYVWQAHAPIALKAGLASEAIDAIRTGRRPQFERPDETAVHDYCRDLLETKFVGEAVYAAALNFLDAKGVVELTCLIGYYAMVAMSLNAHGQSLPPGSDGPLPPLSREKLL